ncbi:MAG: hypothetical protein ACTSVU_08130 [Promethearchaeota archaeon]
MVFLQPISSMKSNIEWITTQNEQLINNKMQKNNSMFHNPYASEGAEQFINLSDSFIELYQNESKTIYFTVKNASNNFINNTASDIFFSGSFPNINSIYNDHCLRGFNGSYEIDFTPQCLNCHSGYYNLTIKSWAYGYDNASVEMGIHLMSYDHFSPIITLLSPQNYFNATLHGNNVPTEFIIEDDYEIRDISVRLNAKIGLDYALSYIETPDFPYGNTTYVHWNGTITVPDNIEGYYVMSIVALDYDYNEVWKNITCWGDYKGPTVNILNRPTSGILEVSSKNFELSWNATDKGVGIDHFEIYFEKTDHSLVLLKNTTQFSAELTLPSKESSVKGINYADYYIEIHAFDKIGNEANDYISIRYTNDFFGFSTDGGFQAWQIIVGLFIIGIASIITLKVIRKKKKPLISDIINKKRVRNKQRYQKRAHSYVKKIRHK